MKPNVPAEFADDPLFLEVMKEALEMQERFSAEPVYANTGIGYLKSAGVAELQKIKKGSQPKKPGT